jgi:Chaperone of endosialidase
MDQASEVLFALKPVSFRYKKEFDAGGAPMFGLIAEDVEQVDPGLVSRNEKGEVESVRYEMINAMLLNEFLKEHKKGQQQDRKIEELEAIVARLESVLKEQAAQIQKMSARVETNGRTTQIVAAR